MTPRQRRRLGVTLVGVALLFPLFEGSSATGSPVQDKRAQARRLVADLERQAERLSVLDEQYDQARLALERAKAGVERARTAKEHTNRRYQTVRTRLRQRAVEAYVRGGPLARVPNLMEGDGNDIVARREYLDSVSGEDRRALDELRAAREDLDVEQDRLDAAVDKSLAAGEKVKKSRRAAQGAYAAERATLSRVQGEIAGLVREEAARRAAERARTARAELTARQDRARARASARLLQGTVSSRRSSGAGRAPAPQGPVGPGPAPSGGAAAAVAEARRQIGKPYSWGAGGPGAFDCSGLTSWAWRAGGISLPHSSRAQYSSTVHVSVADVQPGDLLFYGSPIHHVGIYVGGGQMVEASHAGVPVRYGSIYRRDLVGVGRPS